MQKLVMGSSMRLQKALKPGSFKFAASASRSRSMSSSMSSPPEQLQLYGHYVSQPARAVAWLLKMEGIPFDFRRVQPMLGDCKKDDYLSKFPTGLSPAIETAEGFKLVEGSAILQYLCEKNGLEHWWPTSGSNSVSTEQRALLAAYMSSYHTTTRRITKEAFYLLMRAVMFPKKEAFDEDKAALICLEQAKQFEQTWLAPYADATDGVTFIAGMTTPTVADLLAYCEVAQAEQMEICEYKGKELPLLRNWLNAMSALDDHDDVHASLLKLTALRKKQVAQAS